MDVGGTAGHAAGWVGHEALAPLHWVEGEVHFYLWSVAILTVVWLVITMFCRSDWHETPSVKNANTFLWWLHMGKYIPVWPVAVPVAAVVSLTKSGKEAEEQVAPYRPDKDVARTKAVQAMEEFNHIPALPQIDLPMLSAKEMEAVQAVEVILAKQEMRRRRLS